MQTADMTFDEYLDLAWPLMDDESLSDDEADAKLRELMTARGIPEERQIQLGVELLSAFTTRSRLDKK
jgi:hypothetical protein